MDCVGINSGNCQPGTRRINCPSSGVRKPNLKLACTFLLLAATCLGMSGAQDLAELETASEVSASPAEIHKIARQQECSGDPSCVDNYFRAASEAWNSIASDGLSRKNAKAWDFYHAALKRLIFAGQRFGRLDASSKLTVLTDQESQTVRVKYHGFNFSPHDFHALLDPQKHRSDELNCHYRSQGLGVPLIVMRRQCECGEAESFLPDELPFAATVVLHKGMDGWSLDFFDPIRVQTFQDDGKKVSLAHDISAPLAWLLKSSDNAPKSQALEGFVLPKPSQDNGLFMLEPLQPGKIPLVFVHGLLSDPYAFINVVNELRTDPEFNRLYQVWFFNYATGVDFLSSARDLRQSLQRVMCLYDPAGTDIGLSRTVLVGHSMGGLLCRLQVSRSCGELWKAYAFKSFDRMRMTTEQRARIAETIYFEPLPFVQRVVYVGVPHNGGLRGPAHELRRLFMAVQVKPDREIVRNYQQLKLNNPLAFRPLVRRRLPTSVDMMAPTSPLIPRIQKLTVNPLVRVHTIYAISPKSILQNNDGLVSVASATKVDSHSILQINERHIKMQEHPDAIREVRRILHEHLLAPPSSPNQFAN